MHLWILRAVRWVLVGGLLSLLNGGNGTSASLCILASLGRRALVHEHNGTCGFLGL